MATLAQNLATAREQIAARIVDITATPKPDYSIDGESISWGAYLTQLTQQLEALDKAIQRSDGPFEVRTRAAT
jgi:hypothetical protein